MITNNHYIIDKIGKAAMYEQAAEEATEYAKACLKMARIIREENPTPVSYSEAQDNLVEEWTDQVICARQLDLQPNDVQIRQKHNRFLKRWEDAHGNTSV